MLPGTLVYVNAGTQLAQLRGLGGILSPPLLGSLLLLALFPWLAKAATRRWQIWRLYRPWQRPRHFDRNLIVIGAGAAGLSPLRQHRRHDRDHAPPPQPPWPAALTPAPPTSAAACRRTTAPP